MFDKTALLDDTVGFQTYEISVSEALNVSPSKPQLQGKDTHQSTKKTHREEALCPYNINSMLTIIAGSDWLTLRPPAQGRAPSQSITTIPVLIRAEPFQETQHHKSFLWILKSSPSTPLHKQSSLSVPVCTCVFLRMCRHSGLHDDTKCQPCMVFYDTAP